jgi:hypothetical protein
MHVPEGQRQGEGTKLVHVPEGQTKGVGTHLVQVPERLHKGEGTKLVDVPKGREHSVAPAGAHGEIPVTVLDPWVLACTYTLPLLRELMPGSQ